MKRFKVSFWHGGKPRLLKITAASSSDARTAVENQYPDFEHLIVIELDADLGD